MLSLIHILLNNPNFHYNLILKHEKIVKKFDEIITKYMIEDSECAEIIIGKYIYEKNQNRDEIYLPCLLYTSILTSKYILRVIGKPTEAIRFCKSNSIKYTPFKIYKDKSYAT